MNHLEYEGYTAVIEPDFELGLLTGYVVDIQDEIYFEGKTLEELESSMHRAVDGYLATCEKLGKSPDKPYSGRFIVRTSPAVHRRLHVVAERSKVSMNQYVNDLLTRELESK